VFYGHAAHVEMMDNPQGVAHIPTIAWTTLRVAHMSTEPKAAGSLRQKTAKNDNGKWMC
jgi:hypothetical protein